MKLTPVHALYLALQQTFPNVMHHVSRLLEARDKCVKPSLSWPEWCHFPVGLSYDLLKTHYGYERDGVEPFLLSALAGWKHGGRMLRMTAESFKGLSLDILRTSLPTASLLAQNAPCLYLEYPPHNGVRPGALGSFIFQDFNGADQQHTVFLLHMERYRVEPICLPLGDGRKTMSEMADDLDRAVKSGSPSHEAEPLFEKAMQLCRVNLAVLNRMHAMAWQAKQESRMVQ